jgi:hypothetical protein
MTRTATGAVVALLLSTMQAAAEEWISRRGSCYEWEGIWRVERQGEVWLGEIEFIQVGGPCARPTGEVVLTEVRAVVTEGYFFAYRTTGSYACHMHGRVRPEGVTGSEQGQNAPPHPFVLQFKPREELPRGR